MKIKHTSKYSLQFVWKTVRVAYDFILFSCFFFYFFYIICMNRATFNTVIKDTTDEKKLSTVIVHTMINGLRDFSAQAVHGDAFVLRRKSRKGTRTVIVVRGGGGAYACYDYRLNARAHTHVPIIIRIRFEL